MKRFLSLVSLLAFALSAGAAVRMVPNEGVLFLKRGDALPAHSTVGPRAALVVDVGEAPFAVGEVIDLFHAPFLTLSDGEMLSDAVFLSGAALEAELSYEWGTGLVRAKVLSCVSNATMKVSVWVRGNDSTDSPVQYWDYGGDGTWSDGIPGPHDTALFIGDCYVYGYDTRVPYFRMMAVRGGCVTFRSGFKWPALTPRRIVGTGTIALSSTGIECVEDCGATVGRNITVETAYFTPDQDSWLRARRGRLAVNGPVVVRESYLRVYRGVDFNGPLTVDSPYAPSLIGRDADSYLNGVVTLNSPLTVAAGNVITGKVILNKEGELTLAAGVPMPRVEVGDAGTVSVRKENDNVVVSRLFWTPSLIAVIITGLLAAIAALFILAYVLGKKVMRRTHQLRETMRDREMERIAYDATRRERLRLAHDLHDDFQQLLTSARFRLVAGTTFLSDGNMADAQDQLEAARVALDTAQTGLRATLWTMSEESEGPGSLLDLFRHAARRMAHWQGIVEFTQEGKEPTLARQLMGRMLMILQEAVGNAITHGDATKVRVRVAFGDRTLTMTITDNGEGFDPASVSAERGHFGIRGMTARVRECGGSLTIDSAPGKGATVTAVLAY